MPSYKMSMPAWKKHALAHGPDAPKVDIPVVAVRKGGHERYGLLAWEQLLLEGQLYHVVDGSRAPSGVVWFRQGTSKDGSLAGRVLLYSEGA